jgi:exonuclease III
MDSLFSYGLPKVDASNLSRIQLSCWNLQSATGKRLGAQIHHLTQRNANVLVLTEVRANLLSNVSELLAMEGYATFAEELREERAFSTLIATRGVDGEQMSLADRFDPECAARVVAVSLHAVGNLNVVGVYSPTWSEFANDEQELQKRKFHEDFASAASHVMARGSTLLLGDLNFIEPGHCIGMMSFRRWENEYKRLLDAGFVDVFRKYAPIEREFSWRCAQSGRKQRLDYAFADSKLSERVMLCRYDHTANGSLSDHSILDLIIE